MSWSVWQSSADYCSLFYGKPSFAFSNIVASQAQNARKINDVSGHYMQRYMSSPIALTKSSFYRATTFGK